MNIYFHSFCSYSISFFKENALPVLTAQHKKNFAIASLALGALVVCFIIKRCCFKVSVEEEDKKMSFSPFPSFKQEADLNDESLNGVSQRILDNGDIHEGQFKDDILYGLGKITFANGDIHEGEFKEGQLNGLGKITCAA